MMKFEDYFDYNTTGVVPFDFETFIEGSIRNQPERDYRDFDYHAEILRPRHIVETYKCLEQYGLDNLLMATGPAIMYKGQSYHSEVVMFTAFVDYINGLADLLALPNMIIALICVRRKSLINQSTITEQYVFQLSYVKIPQ